MQDSSSLCFFGWLFQMLGCWVWPGPLPMQSWEMKVWNPHVILVVILGIRILGGGKKLLSSRHAFQEDFFMYRKKGP